MYKFTLKGQRNRYKILCINYIIHTSTGISVNVLTACNGKTILLGIRLVRLRREHSCPELNHSM